jgi:curli production assembly/transport component CsgE
MARLFINLFFFTIWFLFPGKPFAQTAIHDSLIISQDTSMVEEVDGKGNHADLELEIDGLLIDETRTTAGHDFYDLLFSLWEAPADAGNYLIRIQEKPYRVTLTMLEVWVNEELVINTVLQPRREIIEELATNVNRSLQEYLINYSQIMEQLESEDQSGSGIY